MTKRPELNPNNHTAVYEYYEEPQIRQWLDSLWRRAGKFLYKPEVLLSDATRDLIEAQFAMGKSALIASNHPSGHDILALPGALHATGIAGLQQTGALGKDSLFHGPLGMVSEATGSIPVFRQKSWQNTTSRSTLLDAGKDLIHVVAKRLQNGQSIVVMAEGTNSTEQALTHLSAKDIKGGIAHMAIAATDQASFLLPVGIHYTHDRHQKLPPRHPIVAIGEPIVEYEQTIPQVKKQILEGMQTALDLANAHQMES